MSASIEQKKKLAREAQKRCKKNKILKRICLNCSNPCDNPTQFCTFHWKERAARSAGTTTEVINELYNEQGGACPYTGVKLVPGVNMSVDHKLPKSRGGGNHKENLALISALANEMKRDLTPDEFVDMCRLIARRI